MPKRYVIICLYKYVNGSELKNRIVVGKSICITVITEERMHTIYVCFILTLNEKKKTKTSVRLLIQKLATIPSSTDPCELTTSLINIYHPFL